MRLKIASVLLLAGTVVGCANNPPPPPPMAAAPEPAPAPMTQPTTMAPMAGTYRGQGMATGSSSCRNPRGMQSARVRGNTIMIAGMRGTIGEDGTVTGRNLSGNVNGNMADVTVKRGACSYEYKLTNNSGRAMNRSSGMNGSSSSMPMNGSDTMNGTTQNGM
ncbi:MAG: hypothetical protein RQ966_06795 [Acetobacteraceae bacterium]|nr:hypothetical protein [Acetobacteraceae bacterium]